MLQLPTPQFGRLQNGMRYVYVGMPSTNFVVSALIGAAGRRAETWDEVGSAHFLEHLFFGGTERFPSPIALSERIEALGIRRSGSTSPQHVVYWSAALPEHAEVGADYIADIFLHSRLTPEDIAREQGVIGTEVKWNRDQPNRYLPYMLRQLCYPEQIVGTTILDEEARLMDKNQASLFSFRERLYGKENFVALIAGPIDAASAQALAEKHFGTEEYRSVTPTHYEKPMMTPEKLFRHEAREVDQAHLVLGWEGFADGDSRAAALSVMGYILGNKQNSRLGKILRLDRNIVYELPRFNSGTQFDYGFSTLTMRLKNESDLQESYETALQQINAIAEHGVPPDELTSARAVYKSNQLMQNEDMRDCAFTIATDFLWTDQPVSFGEKLEQAARVSAEDVQEAARHILRQNPKVVALSKNPGGLQI